MDLKLSEGFLETPQGKKVEFTEAGECLVAGENREIPVRSETLIKLSPLLYLGSENLYIIDKI